MKTITKQRNLYVLEKRRNYLIQRISKSRDKDLSYDKSEVSALRYAIELVKKDIE